ncbi:MAG: hypothetical protein Q7R66_14765, partial [Undibacterium sp.]|uniref:hypothetical protein n=1 Tax=Undibacterium sp. TaxID=1914977 RepID=UPI00271EEE6E
TLGDAFARADLALYRSKEECRNRDSNHIVHVKAKRRTEPIKGHHQRTWRSLSGIRNAFDGSIKKFKMHTATTQHPCALQAD